MAGIEIHFRTGLVRITEHHEGFSRLPEPKDLVGKPFFAPIKERLVAGEIRLRSAQKLARMIVPYDHTQTIFGISAAMTKPKMLRWVLISWWADGGVEDWCNEWQDIADEFGRSQN